MIEDTSKRDPAWHLLGMLDSTELYITGMEAAGQRQLVMSDLVPTEGSEALAALGFKLGEEFDPLFRHATPPPGWTRHATDHGMWSVIRDEHGCPRVKMYYKASFYDRHAACRVVTLQEYAMDVMHGEEALILGGEWAAPDAMAETLREMISREEDRLRDWAARGVGAKFLARTEEIKADFVALLSRVEAAS
jgi:hypothetical protein